MATYRFQGFLIRFLHQQGLTTYLINGCNGRDENLGSWRAESRQNVKVLIAKMNAFCLKKNHRASLGHAFDFVAFVSGVLFSSLFLWARVV